MTFLQQKRNKNRRSYVTRVFVSNTDCRSILQIAVCGLYSRNFLKPQNKCLKRKMTPDIKTVNS